MKLIILTILTIFHFLNCSENITELTSETFNSSLKENERGFIMFYSSEDANSQSIRPVFEEASKLAQEKGMKNVTFFMLNVDKYQDVMNKFDFFDFPSIIWFDNTRNYFTLYSGNTEMASSFLEFIQHQLTFNVAEINFDEWKEQIYPEIKKSGKYTEILIFVGNKNKDKNQKILNNVMNTAWDEDFKYLYWTNDEKFHSYYNVDKNKFDFLMFKVRLDDSLNHIDQFEKLNITESDCELEKEFKISKTQSNNKIETILKLFAKDVLTIFDPDQERMIVLGIPTMVLVHNFELGTTEYEKMIQNLLTVANKYRKQIFFMIGSPRTKLTQILTESFGLRSKEFPTLCMLSLSDAGRETIEKYKVIFENKLESPSAEMLDEFIQKWLDYKIEPYINSEPIPSDEITKNNHGIIKLVGKNFYDVTMAPGHDIFLVLCEEKIEECGKFKEIYKKIVKKLGRNEKLKFTECNPYVNEINFIGYDSIPGIVMFPDKDHKIVHNTDYKGRLTTREIVRWIKENVVHNITIEDPLDLNENDLKEEINELKAIKLNESGNASKLHDAVIDKEQHDLFKSHSDKEYYLKERKYLAEKMYKNKKRHDVELEIKDDL